MPDMNTALHAQESNVSTRCYRQQSMGDRKRLKVWLHFSKRSADYARYNICNAMCKASGGNTSNLREHLQRFLYDYSRGAPHPANQTTCLPKRIMACSNMYVLTVNVIHGCF
ncbi:hypothetical protein ILYODFUR_037193 [Ilyodon furcidens]|uniref:BED-type domain-containing protein n=1 Tax=Ilyodon furcidens TaxID=33524 RepID=A0ABV0U2S5_9TELE